mmetsp:Transcript_12031/g.27847  ORF Transcript_12031/g.27847 Transcript_12031/m.27847 type:complete len:80 (-) Transcript_12031:403-642(-)
MVLLSGGSDSVSESDIDLCLTGTATLLVDLRLGISTKSGWRASLSGRCTLSSCCVILTGGGVVGHANEVEVATISMLPS